VDASGFSELDYAPAETAPTGTWTINLYILHKNGYVERSIGSTTVSVKEFLPDSMKVDAGLSEHVADGWVKPGALKGPGGCAQSVRHPGGQPARGSDAHAQSHFPRLPQLGGLSLL